MTILTIPTLAGLTYPVKKMPLFENVIAHISVSGSATQQNPQPYAPYDYEQIYSFLRADNVNLELQTLMAFYEQCQGPTLPFHFQDPDDKTVTDQSIGTGDGVTTDFGFVRTLTGTGGITNTKPVQDADATGLVVKVDGVTKALGTDYSILTTAQYATNYGVRFAGGHIPAVGKAVTVTMNYWWLCRFTMTSVEFSKFVEFIWENPSLKFRSQPQ